MPVCSRRAKQFAPLQESPSALLYLGVDRTSDSFSRSPKVLSFLQKQHATSFSHPTSESGLLFATCSFNRKSLQTQLRENPQIFNISTYTEDTGQSVRGMTEALQDPPPSLPFLAL